MKTVLFFLLILLLAAIVLALVGYLYFMRIPRFCRSAAPAEHFLITQPNRFAYQGNYECSTFSTTYVLRHWDYQRFDREDPFELYRTASYRISNGAVLPRGIQKICAERGYHAVYCHGSLDALRTEISKGNPVIVLIRTFPDKYYLHYVPVVGYDKDHIYIAESMKILENCDHPHYNRRLTNAEFLQLWNTSMLVMPFYRRTYLTIQKD